MSLIKGIHHVSIKCVTEEEYEKAVHFYKDVLGLPATHTWADGCLLDTGAGNMEVLKNAEEQLKIGVIRHFAFDVTDVEACVKAVADEGYEVFMPVTRISLGTLDAKIAFCYGPLGEEVEFFQVL